ncbi:hypothetical protein DSL72_007960 [Monilinia vaccinii-corymbosi]|uniref:Major facilitator superfamily (MFS) profile domain-containing protein n=1 Tax=Monilinia vaccinii-corymbosi TaxID=61207 RepID=A0A8A3PJI7_9HELO|nr:hypothetical protein DSL72_007960 [Monilinia vaccinii-corymbosi]
MPHHYEQVGTSTEGVPSWREDEVELPSRSKLYLFCLTISIGGLQVVWATVMAQGSSYLISLDLKPAIVSLVWLAGPVCGTVLQPYIGYKSDFCTHRWGRRRPFMICGTIFTIAFINALAWTSEIVRLIWKILEVSDHVVGENLVIQVLAIAEIWAMNIAIQPVQASIRALIVDSCPGAQAAIANSYASIAVIIGSGIGYSCAFIKLPEGPAWLTNPQFKSLCFIASVSLGATVAITSLMIEEKALDIDNFGKSGIQKIWTDIFKAIRTLPPKIKRIMAVQFCAWLAWFPFLFNIVLYLSKIYDFQILSEKIGPVSVKFYKGLRQESIRHATLAMLVFSMVALATNLCLPYLVTDADFSTTEPDWQKAERSTDAKSGIFVVLKQKIGSCRKLGRVWMISHIITAIALFGMTIGGGFMTSVCFVSLLGISWTLTQWAPFAMISAEIAASSIPDSKEIENDTEDQYDISEGGNDLKPRAGITMAIHNIAIAMPQMLSAVTGAVIYSICRQSNLGDTEAMRWVLRMGIVAGGFAAWFARKL